MKSMSSGVRVAYHNIYGKIEPLCVLNNDANSNAFPFASGFFEAKPRRKNRLRAPKSKLENDILLQP